MSIADATVNSFHSVVEDEESNKRDDFSKSVSEVLASIAPFKIILCVDRR